MTDQELYEALGIRHFESGGYADDPWAVPYESPEEKERKRLAGLNAERVQPNLSMFAKYENPGYYQDSTFNPGGAKDKGFNWGIDADEFYKTFGDNPQTIFGDRDSDGKYLTLASGQKLGVAGRNASMEYTPEHDEYYVNGKTFQQYSNEVAPYDPMNQYDSDRGGAAPTQPTMEDWLATGKLTVQKLPDMFHITTDASGILGRDDSGRYLDVTYIKNGDKFVPVTQPNIADYSNRAAENWNTVGQMAAMVAMAYGAPYLAAEGTAATAATATSAATPALAPGAAGSIFSMAPGTAATMVNAGVTGGLTSAGVQGVTTGTIDPVRTLRDAGLSAAAGGVGDYLKGSEAFQAVPKSLQPGVAAGAGAVATGKNPLAAFIGAETSYAVNGVSKYVADELKLDWNTLPKTARDMITTAVGSAAKGGDIKADVLNVMVNAGLNAAKDFVKDALPETLPDGYSRLPKYGFEGADRYDPKSPNYAPFTFEPISKDGLAGAEEDTTPEGVKYFPEEPARTPFRFEELSKAGLEEPMGVQRFADIETTPTLAPVTVTGTQDPLLPLVPGDLNPGPRKIPEVVATTPPRAEQPNVPLKPGPTGNPAPRPQEQPQPNPLLATTAQAAIPDYGVYKAQYYNPKHYASFYSEDPTTGEPAPEENAGDNSDDLLKSLGISTDLYGYAQGGSVEELLKYLRK
jgi:hypothetical protein